MAKQFQRRRFLKIFPKYEQKNSLKKIIKTSLEHDHLHKPSRDPPKVHPTMFEDNLATGFREDENVIVDRPQTDHGWIGRRPIL